MLLRESLRNFRILTLKAFYSYRTVSFLLSCLSLPHFVIRNLPVFLCRDELPSSPCNYDQEQSFGQVTSLQYPQRQRHQNIHSKVQTLMSIVPSRIAIVNIHVCVVTAQLSLKCESTSPVNDSDVADLTSSLIKNQEAIELHGHTHNVHTESHIIANFPPRLSVCIDDYHNLSFDCHFRLTSLFCFLCFLSRPKWSSSVCVNCKQCHGHG